jgi:hypothetical protein
MRRRTRLVIEVRFLNFQGFSTTRTNLDMSSTQIMLLQVPDAGPTLKARGSQVIATLGREPDTAFRQELPSRVLLPYRP